MSVDEDLFNSIVRGRYKLAKEGNGCASDWISHSDEAGKYVPRPDCSLTTLKILSVVGGILGIDHFYVRSPITGLIKMATFGGVGLWWLWDIIQLFGESDRVLNYGMSAPLDIVTGIGQGMITDKTSIYKTSAPYSPWFVSIMFSFMGMDALLAKNTGQFLRKFTECLILVGCCIGIWRVVMGGITAGAIVGLFILCVIAMMFATIVVDEYISVLNVIFSGTLFTTGLTFTQKQDEQYNGMFKGILHSLAAIMFSTEKKNQMVKDLQYGGVDAAELIKMFTIQHPSEFVKQQNDPPKSKPSEASSIFSFIILLISPFLLIATWVWHVIGLFYPPARYMEIAAEMGIPLGGFDVNTLKKGVKSGDIKGHLKQFVPSADGVKSILTDGIKDSTKSTPAAINDFLKGTVGQLGQGPKGLSSTLEKMNDTANTVGKIGQGAAQRVANTLKSKIPTQGGGAREEPLSTEAQVFGAVIVALIGGGAMKGLVDYLIVE